MLQDLASIAIVVLLVLGFAEFAEAVLLSVTEIPFKNRRVPPRLFIRSRVENRRVVTVGLIFWASFCFAGTVLAVTSRSPSPPLERVVGALGLLIEGAWVAYLIVQWRKWRSINRAPD